MNDTKEKHATHTPGPWYTYQSCKDVNRQIACKDGNSIAKEVHHANARLIAAAPEMYDLLCKISNSDLGDIETAIQITLDAREVLAKVEGGEG